MRPFKDAPELVFFFCPLADQTAETVFWNSEDKEPRGEGFFFWNCQPGCLPDSEPFGPYSTLADAIKGAADMFDLEEPLQEEPAEELAHLHVEPTADEIEEAEELEDAEELKLDAIVAHFELEAEQRDDIAADRYDACRFRVPDRPGHYLVLDEAEREERLNSALDEQCDHLLHDMGEFAARYFDRKAWKEDAENEGGAGPILSGYDGEEYEEVIEVQGKSHYFFIYRIQ